MPTPLECPLDDEPIMELLSSDISAFCQCGRIVTDGKGFWVVTMVFKDLSRLQANLEFDNESEDELDALAEMYDPGNQGHTTERFRLLKDLWVSAR